MNASPHMTLLIVATIIIALLLPTTLHAHPHVFIDIVETIHLDDHGIAGVSQEWRLQGAFSLDTQHSYDLNRDGEFSEAEQASIYDTTFLPLWLEVSFFRLHLMGVEYTAVSVQDFSAQLSSGEVRFNFYIPCGIQGSEQPIEIDMITYDSSIYISFDLYDCRVSGGDGTQYSLEFVPDPSILSHGRDGCGTRVRFSIEPQNPAQASKSGAAIVADNLVPMVGNGPAAPVNPFTGYGLP